MKKGTLIRNIITSVCILELCMGAFFLSFLSNLQVDVGGGNTLVFKNIVWGCRQITLNGEAHTLYELLGFNSSGFAVLPGIGLLMILFASIAAAIITWVVKKPFAKWILLGLALVILGGAIMQFFSYSAFIRSMVNQMAKASGVTDKETIKQAYETYKQQFDQSNPKYAVSIVSGVFGILGALGVSIPKLIPEKK